VEEEPAMRDAWLAADKKQRVRHALYDKLRQDYNEYMRRQVAAPRRASNDVKSEKDGAAGQGCSTSRWTSRRK
jgi:anti-sigma factor RsiW